MGLLFSKIILLTLYFCLPCFHVSMYLHMDMWRLEAALVDVVMREGLCGVGAVLVHRDGHFAMSHPSTVWT